MSVVVLFKRKEIKMPVYSYVCDKHGEFEDLRSINDRDKSQCPECHEECNLVLSTNKFAAKTRYIPPPLATRKFGDDKKTPYKRPKWI